MGDQFDPDWSPIDDTIVFWGIDGGVYTIQSDGTNLQRLASGIYPTWSPDGQAIAYVDIDGFIRVIDRNGNFLRTLNNVGGDTRDPAWSPDGNWVAFASNRNGFMEMYIVDAQLGEQVTPAQKLTDFQLDASSGPRDTSWLYNGAEVSFSSWPSTGGSGRDVWSVTIDGTNTLTQWTSFTGNEYDPDWILLVDDTPTPTPTPTAGICLPSGSSPQSLNSASAQAEGTEVCQVPTNTPTSTVAPTLTPTVTPTALPFACEVRLDPYATIFIAGQGQYNGLFSLTKIMFNIYNDGSPISRTELNRIREAFNDDLVAAGQPPVPFALGDSPNLFAEPTNPLFAVNRLPDAIQMTLPNGALGWVYSGYGLTFAQCANPPTTTRVDPFLFDNDGIVDTTNFFNPSPSNNPLAAHPLDTSLGDLVLMRLYIRDSVSGPLAEYSDYLSRCSSSDPICPDRIYTRMSLEAENRFNQAIYDSAIAHNVPPLLLKLVMMQESGLVPAFSENGARASGIGQIVDWNLSNQCTGGVCYGGAGELVRLGRGQIPLPGGTTIAQGFPTQGTATLYRNFIDGLPGSTTYGATAAPPNCPALRDFSPVTNSRAPANETDLCVDFDETLRAIDDTAFLLRNNYDTLQIRIAQTINTPNNPYWSNLSLSNAQKENIVWTWAIATYNQGNGIYNNIPNIPSLGPIASANAVCQLGAVTSEANGYVGSIITGDPGSGTQWCDLGGQ
jgi:hypothetical protein